MDIPILRFKQLSSTMDKAKSLVDDKATPLSPPFAVISETQDSGRGSYGKAWYSQDSGGLYYTLVCSPHTLSLNNHPLLLATLIKEVCELIQRLTGLPCRVKQPNDLFIDDKKIGGILVETRSSSHLKHPDLVFFGLGLNLNQLLFPPELETIATSLRLVSGKTYRIESFIPPINNLLLSIL